MGHASQECVVWASKRLAQPGSDLEWLSSLTQEEQGCVLTCDPDSPRHKEGDQESMASTRQTTISYWEASSSRRPWTRLSSLAGLTQAAASKLQ